MFGLGHWAFVSFLTQVRGEPHTLVGADEVEPCKSSDSFWLTGIFGVSRRPVLPGVQLNSLM
jgi:hypothetical protein